MASDNRDDQSSGAQSSRQIRRAWGTLVAAFGIRAALRDAGRCGVLVSGHATVKHAACVEVVQGDRAFIRPAYQRNWNAIPGRQQLACNRPVELHEGDTLQTPKGPTCC